MSASSSRSRLVRPLVVLGLLAAPALAQRQALVPVRPPARSPQGGGGALPITGDSPLQHLETFTGRIDAQVDVVAHSFADDTAGSFTLAGIPTGAEILRAWLLVTSFDPDQDQAVGVSFAGEAFPARLPDVMDPGVGFGGAVVCCLYRFDVTPLVSGDGSYAYQATGNSNAFGDALVVVYEHPSLQSRVIALADGAESLDEAATSTVLPALPPGPGELALFTTADDADGIEEIRWNGATVVGPGSVFAANEGSYASLVTLPVIATAGDNALEVQTTDWLGLHLALLKVATEKVVVDFETEDDGVTPLVNGQAVEGGDEMGLHVRIDGFPASGLTAAVFDSTPGGPNDPSQDVDLLVGRGNVLILQERPLQTVPGVYDRPNDDADGGRFELDFLGREVLVCTLELADVDGGDPGSSEVTLRDAAGASAATRSRAAGPRTSSCTDRPRCARST